eukprot:scaffold54351_cov51-Attheya_sp.AAC.1
MYDVYRECDDEEGSRCVDWIVAHCRGMGRGRKEFACGEFGGTGAIGWIGGTHYGGRGGILGLGSCL